MLLENVFKALADKTRIRILALLFQSNLCVCEVVHILKMSQSRVSRHIGILKQAGLIKEERKGKWIIYKIADKRSPILSYIRRGTKDDPDFEKDLKNMEKTLKKNMCPFN